MSFKRRTTQTCAVWHGVNTVGFGAHSTHYQSFWEWFYRSDDPTNSVIGPKDNSQLSQGPMRFKSLKGKVQNLANKIYSTTRTKATEALGRNRALPSMT